MSHSNLILDIFIPTFNRKSKLLKGSNMVMLNLRKEKIGCFRISYNTFPSKKFLRFVTILLSIAMISIAWAESPGNYERGDNIEEKGLKPMVDDDLALPLEATLPINDVHLEPKLSYKLSYTYADGKTVEFSPESVGVTGKNTRVHTPYLPLSKERITLLDLDEIAIGNLRKTDVGTKWVFDDKHREFKNFHTSEFDAENLGGSDMVAGDLDGDGRDELVISSELDFIENDLPVSMTQVSFFDDASTNFELLNTTVFWITSCSLTAGDLDGDGLDEVAMIGNYQGNVSMAGVVFDDRLAPDQVFHLWDPIEGGLEINLKETSHHDIVSGDFDGDGMDELATIGYYNDTLISWVWAWNDDPEEKASKYNGMNLVYTLPEMQFTKGQPSLATGDIDGDARDELIVTTHDDEWKIHYWIYDDLQSNFEILKDVRDNITIRSTESATGDIDGDGLDEIFLVGHKVAHLVGRVLDDANHDYALLKVLDTIFDDKWFYWFNVKVETGDIDGDGYDEYAILGQSYIFLYGELHDDLGPGNNEMLKKWEIGDNKLPTLAIGDFDGDGLILEYTGEHVNIETPSIPIVAMSTPPVIEGINQNSAESFTRFGIPKSDDSDKSYQMNISAEIALSFEGEPIKLLNGEKSALLEEFNITQTPVEVNVNNISFESHYPDDYIIYQNTTYNQFKYRILSWPGHDDRVGENISINVPLTINLGHKTLVEYNKEKGEDQGIDNKFFQHQVGNISSYPDLEERDVILYQYYGWSSDTISVGQGDGITNISIDLSKELINEQMFKFGTPWSHLDGLIEGFETTTSLTSDLIYDGRIGNHIRYEGGIGHIKNMEEFTEWGYSFGIFVYQREELESGLEYMVINYWVEEKEKLEPLNSKFYGHWSFDTLIDSNITEDLFEYHNNANVKGSTITNGVKNKALYFDGINDEVEVLIDRPRSNITVELWFKTNQTNIGLISFLSNSEIIDNNNLQFYLVDGKPRQEINTSQAWNANVSLADGLWHYWVWTIEAEEGQKLYIDGELVGVNSLDHSEYFGDSHLAIGYSPASTQPYFKGTIDEVKVHEIVLNSTTIIENFEAINNESANNNSYDKDDENENKDVLNTLIIMLIVVGIVVLVGNAKGRKDKKKN